MCVLCMRILCMVYSFPPSGWNLSQVGRQFLSVHYNSFVLAVGWLSVISQLASRVGEGGGVWQLCLHSVTQPYTTWPRWREQGGRLRSLPLVSPNENSCPHHVTWSPNKLWRSNSLFNLWPWLLIKIFPLPLLQWLWAAASGQGADGATAAINPLPRAPGKGVDAAQCAAGVRACVGGDKMRQYHDAVRQKIRG